MPLLADAHARGMPQHYERYCAQLQERLCGRVSTARARACLLARGEARMLMKLVCTHILLAPTLMCDGHVLLQKRKMKMT
jgi:hypothetical protein